MTSGLILHILLNYLNLSYFFLHNRFIPWIPSILSRIVLKSHCDGRFVFKKSLIAYESISCCILYALLLLDCELISKFHVIVYLMVIQCQGFIAPLNPVCLLCNWLVSNMNLLTDHKPSVLDVIKN